MYRTALGSHINVAQTCMSLAFVAGLAYLFNMSAFESQETLFACLSQQLAHIHIDMKSDVEKTKRKDLILFSLMASTALNHHGNSVKSGSEKIHSMLEFFFVFFLQNQRLKKNILKIFQLDCHTFWNLDIEGHCKILSCFMHNDFMSDPNNYPIKRCI